MAKGNYEIQKMEKEEGNGCARNNKLVGYGSAVVSMLLLAASIATSQFLAGAIPVFQINLWRFLWQAFGALILRIPAKCDIRMRRENWLLFCAVLASHIGFNVTFFTSSVFLPAGNVGAYAGAALILFNVILSVCIRSERVWHLYISAVLCILGILLLAQPYFIFPDLPRAPRPNWTSPCFNNPEQFNIGLVNRSTTDAIFNIQSDTTPWIGYILVAISGLCISTSFLSMKRFGERENTLVLAFWLGAVGSVLTVVPMLTLETMTFPRDPLCLAVLFLHGISATQTVLLSPFCLQFLTQAQYSFVVTLHMAVLLVLQYSVLAPVHPGNGNWVEVAGGLLCIAACLLGPITDITKSSMRAKDKKDPKQEEQSLALKL